jgi:SAM-dependent methyltransferase
LNEKFLVIAGNGHLKHYCGVPERVLRDVPEIASDTCLVISESTTPDSLAAKNDEGDGLLSFLTSKFGEGSNPADYTYFYEIPRQMLDDWAVKEETKHSYDKVGETANLPGNMLKAAWIMYHLGYTEEQFESAGPDAYNFQGVGNPHFHASIQEGEIVLDVGSGLGIDSIIACYATGPEGLVIGIDISEQETKHALQRVKERGLNAHFMVCDMENMGEKIPDNSVDVIISNGAFCLAPNKKKAFMELFRVLKPGGRISICTTTIQEDNLEPGVSWPLCMKMFIAKNELKPLCEALGFVDVMIDDSNSLMSMEIPEEVLQQSNPDRSVVHVGGEEFRHLEDYDMDKICARVCVVARKPI